MKIEEVIITGQLTHRAKRSPNLAAENRTLHALGQELKSKPEKLLQRVVREAKKLCRAGSAGLSVLARNEQGEEIFQWAALAGVYEPHAGGTTPRDFSPCGVCLDLGGPQLYQRPGRYFTYLNDVDPPIMEGLVVPILVQDQPLGTIWIVSHDERRHFDNEDVRIMTSIAGFTGAALRMKETEGELRRKEAFSRTILDTSPDCIKVLNAAGQLIYINHPGQKLLGISNAATLLNERWVAFWKGKERRAATKALEVAKAGKEGRFSGFRPTFQGLPKWWDVTVNLLPGEMGHFLIISRDITQLKQTEDALIDAQTRLQAHASELEKKVAERTEKLKEAKDELLRITRRLLKSQEEERRYLASELHDQLGQHLTGLKLLLEGMGEVLPKKKGEALDHAQEVLRIVMKQVRNLSFDLRQSLPDHIKLPTALRWHFEKLKQDHGFEVLFRCGKVDKLQKLPPEVARAVFRLVQEALTNVLRHAGVRAARIAINCTGKAIKLKIEDNGRGFDLAAEKATNCSGIEGMKERVLLLGGRFLVESRLSRGT